jgi:hypothetical protein
MTDRELMQQALEAFGGLLTFNPSPAEYKQGRDVVAALRERLAQPKQEHTGFMDSKLNPIKRQWVGLTDEEINHAAEQSDNYASFIAGVLFAQDKLEEKNGG